MHFRHAGDKNRVEKTGYTYSSLTSRQIKRHAKKGKAKRIALKLSARVFELTWAAPARKQKHWRRTVHINVSLISVMDSDALLHNNNTSRAIPPTTTNGNKQGVAVGWNRHAVDGAWNKSNDKKGVARIEKVNRALLTAGVLALHVLSAVRHEVTPQCAHWREEWRLLSDEKHRNRSCFSEFRVHLFYQRKLDRNRGRVEKAITIRRLTFARRLVLKWFFARNEKEKSCFF